MCRRILSVAATSAKNRDTLSNTIDWEIPAIASASLKREESVQSERR